MKEDSGEYGLTIVTEDGKQLAGKVKLNVLGKCVRGILIVMHCVGDLSHGFESLSSAYMFSYELGDYKLG